MNPLKTDRLILRNFRDSDGPSLHAYLSLPETYRFEPGTPVSPEEALTLAADRSSGDTFIAVELEASGQLVGHLYFAQVPPFEFDTWELGYIFHPAHQGKGYATEVCRAFVRYAFEFKGIRKVVAFCDPLNPASGRVLEKTGLVREGHFREKAFFRRDGAGRPVWHDCFAYGLLRPGRT